MYQTFTIKSYCYQTDETYKEHYPSYDEMIIGLNAMLKREDNNMSKEDYDNLIKERFYGDGMDTIELIY